jgi:hypothetical protein
MTEPLIASVSIEAIHGELPLFSVGEEFDVAVGGAPPSALLIIPVSSYAAERPDIEGPLFYGLGLEPDGTFDCNTANPMMPFGALGGGFPELPPLTKEQYIELVQSETCPASLVELDAAWMPTDCGYGMQPGADAGADAGSEPGETDRLGTVQSDESCGCRVPASNAGEPTTLGIFVALVTALAARRQRRATSSRSTSCFE